MVLSIGEILVDVFSSESEHTVFPGGAPFNVASNILSFNCDSSFYGAVGNDEYGKLLLDFVSSKKFINPIIEVKDDRYTTQALVTLNKGERSFKFIRENGADYALNLDIVKNIDYTNVNIVHFGSLMLSFEQGRDFIKKAVQYFRNNHPSIKLSFDVNYRDDIYASNEESIKIYGQFIKLFDIVKFSNDEVRSLSKNSNWEKGLSSLVNDKQFIYVTLGKEGSKLYHLGNVYSSMSYPVKPVDTTGAGDAFYSYVLSKMDKYDFNKLSKEEIENILLKANCVGAMATLKKGAIDVAPNEEEVIKFINSHKN